MHEYTYPPRRRRHSRKRQRRKMLISAGLILLSICAVSLLLMRDIAPGSSIINFHETGPKDTSAPSITGVRDLIAYEGGTIAYRSGITVTDDLDPEPKLDVDSRRVDLNKTGTYEITYTATDSAGNTSQATATVTVLPKQEGYAELDTIYKAADEQIAAIIPKEADAREQAYAIYRWARTELSYSGNSDRTDWLQTAYTMLTEKKGDCYGFFSVTKLLFERLGIPNIDVQKVKNDPQDSDHFWSLVSVDGGTTYYHFDATPRAGSGDNFFLVTDAFLDGYSDDHEGSHNRDKSRYPATPEEAA